MDIFFTIFTNLLPLYGLIALGYVGGKFFAIERDTLANLAIFICMPVVSFGFIATQNIQVEFMLLPVLFFLIMLLIGLGSLAIGRAVYGDERANLLSLCSAGVNSGYFGLPLALLVFEPEWIAVYILTMLGGSFYESTVSYYIAARGKLDKRESLRRLAAFPSLYAIIAGLAYNATGAELPDMFMTYFQYFKGVYIVIGMMIIGAALSKVDKMAICPRFLGLTFLSQFLIWPALVYGCILLDQTLFHIFEESKEVYRILIVISLCPPAANMAAFAAQFNLRPEKAATAILAGTLFALFYIPAIFWLIGL